MIKLERSLLAIRRSIEEVSSNKLTDVLIIMYYLLSIDGTYLYYIYKSVSSISTCIFVICGLSMRVYSLVSYFTKYLC